MLHLSRLSSAKKSPAAWGLVVLCTASWATLGQSAMASTPPSIKLNDGTSHPLIGYGTYKVGFVPASASSAAAGRAAESGPSAAECIGNALKAGYRFLDCAEFYGNQAETGKAIAGCGVPRAELYIASKVWTTTIHKGADAVQAQIEQTLKDLGVDYLDLMCIHWPVPGKHVAAYKQLEAAQKAGLIRSLGVSNYAVEDYKELMESASVKPVVNQIEINPFLYRKNTIGFFKEQGGETFSSGDTAQRAHAVPHRCCERAQASRCSPTVPSAMARSAAQVLGRWCVQHEFIYIPKSVKEERMRENMQVFDWDLDEDDMAQLDALTTDEALQTYRALYDKCVLRDTPDTGKMELVRKELTLD